MQKFKILSVAGCVLLFPLSSMAHALSWLPGHFLVGPEVGYVVRAGHLTSTSFEFSGISVVGEQNEYINNHGTVYGGLVGYQVNCRNYVLGIEGFFDLGRYEEVENYSIPLLSIDANTNLSYYRDSTYGVSARLGYKVKPCFTPYVRVGVQGGEDHLLVNYTGLASIPAFDRYEDRQTSWNWLLGVGLEVPLFSKQSSIRLEYDYSPARHSESVDIALPVLVEYGYAPHSHAVKFQWVWNFV